jgi:protein-disulfide isomerase
MKNFASIASKATNTIMVVCAITLTFLAVRQYRQPTIRTIPQPGFEPQADWLEYASTGHVIGNHDATVIAVEFADFECPACRVLSGNIHEIVSKRPQDFAVLYRYFPLRSHRFSDAAAVAAECAARQGKFREMHDSLFAYQAQFGLKAWTQIAAEAGVPDTSGFSECLADSTSIKTVERDKQAAEQLGLAGTPTLLINGVRFTGVPTKGILDSLVDAALQQKRTVP